MAGAASLTTLVFISLLPAAVGVEVDVAINKFYFDNACSGLVESEEYEVEGKCVWSDNGQWKKTVCMGSQVTMTHYKDDGCTTVDAGQNTETIPTTCRETEQEGVKIWSSWTCGSKMNVFSMTTFNQPGCPSSSLQMGPSVSPWKKDSCTPSGQVESGAWTHFSWKYEGTLSEIKQSHYPSKDCTGNPVEEKTFTCGDVCTEAEGEEGQYYKVDCAPSLGPAATTATAPTTKATTKATAATTKATAATTKATAATTKATSPQASFSTPAAVPQAAFAFAAVSFLTAAL